MIFSTTNKLSRVCSCKLPNSAFSKRSNTTQVKSKPLKWKTVVGLEVHAQISSKSKLFSGAKTDFGALVNNCVSLFDAATPGTLPVLNRRCVEAAVLAALALECKINRVSMFDRKHYFYADLPAGYQITQQRAPIAQDGKLEFQVYTPGFHKKSYRKTSIIKQIQLEQDSGKSLHDHDLERSLVDLNRAGTPLIEIVFEPDLENGEQAAALVRELVLILGRLDCCSGRMQEGALRVDANVSVNLPGESLGTRTEIKNIGSVSGVAMAIDYESNRQISLLKEGGQIVNQTMQWDPEHKVTLAMRDKEVQQDYRYMPEPNLPPLILNMTHNNIPDLVCVPLLEKSIPELPDQTRQRLINKFKVTTEHAIQIVNEAKLLQYFEDITQNEQRKATLVANILLNELLTTLNKNKILLEDCDLTSEALGEVIDLIQNKIINLVTALKILDILVTGSRKTPTEIANKNKWTLINDEEEIEKICLKAMNDNPKLVLEYRSGKKKLFKFFMGVIFKATQETANMAKVSQILQKLLDAKE